VEGKAPAVEVVEDVGAGDAVSFVARAGVAGRLGEEEGAVGEFAVAEEGGGEAEERGGNGCGGGIGWGWRVAVASGELTFGFVSRNVLWLQSFGCCVVAINVGIVNGIVNVSRLLVLPLHPLLQHLKIPLHQPKTRPHHPPRDRAAKHPEQHRHRHGPHPRRPPPRRLRPGHERHRKRRQGHHQKDHRVGHLGRSAPKKDAAPPGVNDEGRAHGHEAAHAVDHDGEAEEGGDEGEEAEVQRLGVVRAVHGEGDEEEEEDLEAEDEEEAQEEEGEERVGQAEEVLAGDVGGEVFHQDALPAAAIGGFLDHDLIFFRVDDA